MKGIITLTNGEVMDIELFEDTPITSENFKKLANSGFYDGLTFHRVIPDLYLKVDVQLEMVLVDQVIQFLVKQKIIRIFIN